MSAVTHPDDVETQTSSKAVSEAFSKQSKANNSSKFVVTLNGDKTTNMM